MEGLTKKIITTAAKVQATMQQNLSSAFAPSRPPSEVVDDNVQGILEGLKLLAAPQQDDARRRGRKKVSEGLQELRKNLQDNEEHRRIIFATLSQQLADPSKSVMLNLIRALSLLEFEARKDVSIIFRNVLQWQQEENLRQTEQQRQESSTAPPSSAPPDPAAPAVPSFSVDFLCEEYDNDHAPAGEQDHAPAQARTNNTLFRLMVGYKYADSTSTCCGQMLRECAKHQHLVSRLLLVIRDSAARQLQTVAGAGGEGGGGGGFPHDGNLFDYMQMPQFDISSDAFATLRELLLIHKKTASKFVDENYDEFFSKFLDILKSKNYLTKRQLLRLLAEILRDRSYQKVMQRYIGSQEQLKVCIDLLGSEAKAMRIEVLQVFSVFVVNPKKEENVLRVLRQDKSRLLGWLREIDVDDCDEEVEEQHQAVEDALRRLKEVEPEAEA